MTRKNIPFSPPDITEAEVQAVAEVLRSGWITTGPLTKELERRLADFCHTDRVVCLASATSAMECTLRMLGVGPGDEVITSAYTYTATASVVCHVGATLRLVDVKAGTREMDYKQLEAAINPRTKVIIPVDLGGIVCDYTTIFSVVERKRAIFNPKGELQKLFGRIIVMADAAHSLGSQRNGKMCGQLADFSCFSFHAVKNFTTAEGGAVTWRQKEGLDTEALYKQFQLFSLHGQNRDALAKTRMGAWEYDVEAPYYKCNMTDIMASIGLVQLGRYPGLLARRRAIIERYNRAFEGIADLQIIKHYTPEMTSNGHLYIVRLLGRTAEQRNEVIAKMAECGIACNVHFKPLPLLTAYQRMGFDIKDYPNAYEMFANAITLPSHTRMSDEDVDYVVSNFITILNNNA